MSLPGHRGEVMGEFHGGFMGVRKPIVRGAKLAEESPELVCWLQGGQSRPMTFGLRQTRLLVSTANFSQLCLWSFPDKAVLVQRRIVAGVPLPQDTQCSSVFILHLVSYS